MKILVIDHDPRSRKTLERVLKDDYIVDMATSAESGEALAYSNYYDLILLDLVLPDMNGEEFCSLLRSRLRETPIVILTQINNIADKVSALDKGADDYITKPFHARELKARIRAILRRAGKQKLNPCLVKGELSLDLKRRICTYRGKRLELRRKELMLLEFLLMNKGTVVTRGEVLENVWDININPFTNTVEVHMKRLRDKIEKPYGIEYIKTVHGIGYMIESDSY